MLSHPALVRSLCVLLLLAGGSGRLEAKEQAPLRVGYLEFPPITATVNGQPQGVLLEIGRALIDAIDYRYSETSYPVKRLFMNLEQGLTDIWYGIRINALAPATLTGKTPIYHINMNLYSLRTPAPIRHKEELAGHSVILMMGYSYSDWGAYIRDPANQIQYVEAKTHQQALRLLSSGRFDYLLDYRYPVREALKEVPVADLAVTPLLELPVYVHVSRRHPRAAELSAALEEAYLALVAAGAFRHLSAP